MKGTHYEVLGVKRTASDAEIRSAYRRIVLRHHPDRSKDPGSKSVFLASTEAYEVLKDAERRKSYDAHLDFLEQRRQSAQASQQAQRAQQQARTQGPQRPQGPPSAKARQNDAVPPIAVDLSRLALLYNRGQYAEAEKLAKQILAKDSKQAIPYAVLGDLARSRGNIDEAQRMYAYAAQMDPRNPVYQRRYEQLLASSAVNLAGKRAKLVAQKQNRAMPIVASGFSLASGLYLAFSSERAVMGPIGIVSTWTLGLITLLFLCGVVAGACLSLGNLLDRFEMATTTSTGKLGPAVSLALIAIANFWCAAMVYALIGFVQRALNYSTTRLVAAVATIVLVLSLGASLGGRIEPTQVLLWGGNLSYLGALVGWMVADSFRP